ncbi:MAG: T9SS type A sorting domain-containing protein [Bacteroidota bacterium]
MNYRCVPFICFLLTFLLFGFSGQTQGWEYTYPNTAFSVSLPGLTIDPDGNFVGVTNLREENDRWLQIVKTTPNGELLWNQEVHPPPQITAYRYYGITNDQDGGYLICGRQTPVEGGLDGFLLKVSNEGEVLWRYVFPQTTFLKGITVLSNGDYLLCGTGENFNLPTVLRVDRDGNVIWEHQYSYSPDNPAYDYAHKVLTLPNNNILVLLSQNGTVELWEYDLEGTLLNQQALDNPNDYYLSACNLAIGPNAEIVVAARQIRLITGTVNRPFYSTMLWKLNAERELVWLDSTTSTTSFQNIENVSINHQGEIYLARYAQVEKRASSGELLCRINANNTRPWQETYVRAVSDGGAVIAAGHGLGLPGQSVLSLNRMNTNCEAAQEMIRGTAFLNLGDDCDDLLAGATLPQWLIELNTGEVSYFDFTDSSGQYQFLLSPDDYEVYLHPPVDYWQSCSTGIPIAVSAGDTIIQDVHTQITEECPYPIVDLGIGSLRPCEERPLLISYGNFGTTDLDTAFLQLYLNPDLSIASASLPYTSIGQDSFRFDLGTLPPNSSGEFTLQILSVCDPDISGTTTCLSAEIFPRTDCGDGAWKGPIITVEGSCRGDSIAFELANIGLSDMTGPQELIVIEDDVMYLQTDFELDAGQSTIYTVPNQEAVYAARAEQVAGYPFGPYAYDFVAYCDNPALSVTPSNFFGQFPYLGDLPYRDTDCVPFVNSFDPNQKTTEPQGFGRGHYIEPNTPLEYRIDFQNTGTDTAYNVVLRDTLSPYLDVRQLQLGPATHHYELSIESGNILVFSFANINLLDSISNEALSQGFATYSITPLSNTPDGTVIENRAGIYFDFNPPIITNTVWHTIQRDFLVVEVAEAWRESLEVVIYPNPSSSAGTLMVKTNHPATATLTLFNSLGQELAQLPVQDQQIQLPTYLAAGFYPFQLWAGGKLQGSGKIIIQ